MTITKKQAERAVLIVIYQRKGAQSFKRKVTRLINTLAKQYDKSIDIDHLKYELRKLNA